MTEQQYLTSHVKTRCPRRKVNCQYCHDTGEHQFIEGQHKEECPKLPLPCPNKCEVGSVLREYMKANKKRCVTKMVQCEYYNIGCKARIPYKEEKHRKEKMEEHLIMMKLKLSETEEMLTHTQERLTSSEERLGKLETIVHQAIGRSETNIDELMMSLRWTIHITTMATMAGSGNLVCPIIIKMSQFARRKDGNIQWYSHSFYTYSGGYKLCMYINAAGITDGGGSHLSLYLHLMKGPHDDKLTWPLRGNFMVTLLNQIRDSNHHSILVGLQNQSSTNCVGNRVMNGELAARGWGTATFVSNEELYKSTPNVPVFKGQLCFLPNIHPIAHHRKL